MYERSPTESVEGTVWVVSGFAPRIGDSGTGSSVHESRGWQGSKECAGLYRARMKNHSTCSLRNGNRFSEVSMECGLKYRMLGSRTAEYRGG